MRFHLFLLAGALLAACTAPDIPAETPAAPPPASGADTPVRPLTSVPDTAAGYAFLRQTIRLSFANMLDMHNDNGWFFSRYPYGLDAEIAEMLVPGRPGFIDTPAPVLREFRQQIARLDTVLQRRLTWDPTRLGQFVFIENTKTKLRPTLAGQVRGVTPAQRKAIRQAITEWNRGPLADRSFSYASWPLFSANGQYALVVRGHTQQSIGWDSIFIYQRTATGWEILEMKQLSTI